MHCFQGVTVGFPAGNSNNAFQAKENLAGASWVLWSTGELRVDAATYGLFFSPCQGGRLTAKPLGCLTGAVALPSLEAKEPQSYVAFTSDGVHSVLRLNFEKPNDEQGFCALANAAEAANTAAFGPAGGRRSTYGRRSSLPNHCREEEHSLALQLSQRQGGAAGAAWPLVVGRAELYGPDPAGEVGSEVLLARGAVVLLDPPESGRIGNYELLFCEEGSPEPVFSVPIGPRTRVQREADEQRCSRLSVASGRQTLGGEGFGAAPTVFSVSLPGAPGWALAFDGETEAAAFERDFLVRQKLVALAQKTHRGVNRVGELREELTELRRYGLVPTVRWLLFYFLLLSSLALLANAGMLYSNDPERPPAELLAIVLQDAASFTMLASERIREAGTAVCGVLAPGVPSAELEKCVRLLDPHDTRPCVTGLIATFS